VANDAALGDFRVGLEFLEFVQMGIAGHDRRGEGGLAVVDVPDGADVDVRFGPLEVALCHRSSLLAMTGPRPHEFGCGAPLNSVPSQSCCWDSNPGPPPYQGGALSAELQQHEPMDPRAGNPAVAFHTSRKTSRPAPHRAQSLNCEV